MTKADTIITEIIEKSDLTKKDVLDKIEEKKQELRGLISDEGAAFIIAKELNIEINVEDQEEKIDNTNAEKPETDWLTEMAEMDVGSNFLTIHNSFKYIFGVDISKQAKPVKKQYKGHDAGVKFQWEIRLFNFEVISSSGANYLKEEKPKKYEYIMNLEPNENYLLELPKSASKEFAAFLKQNDFENKNADKLVSMTRSGDGFQTKYHFGLATEEELGFN